LEGKKGPSPEKKKKNHQRVSYEISEKKQFYRRGGGGTRCGGAGLRVKSSGFGGEVTFWGKGKALGQLKGGVGKVGGRASRRGGEPRGKRPLKECEKKK